MELPLWAESVWSYNGGLWKNFGQQEKEKSRESDKKDLGRKNGGVVLLVAGELG
jgi:hypothetical protein